MNDLASRSYLSAWIGGFTAAEGAFTRSHHPPKFGFVIALASLDSSVCDTVHEFLEVGTVAIYPRRKAHYCDVVVYQVRSLSDLVNTVVPFMDEHLPASHKREQYLRWRRELLQYWEKEAKRVRPCTEAGCDAPRRAHGLCRHHLFKAGLG
jgi:hypothetical protein